MIPIGFEFGFHKRLNVKFTSSDDWEEVRINLTEFIKQVNLLKSSLHIFNQELPLQKIPVQNPHIQILLKDTQEDERLLLIINKNKSKAQALNLDLSDIFSEGIIRDLSLEEKLKDVPELLEIKLKPSQVKILYQSM
jgi:starch synthase (maltosyl-transferring)